MNGFCFTRLSARHNFSARSGLSCADGTTQEHRSRKLRMVPRSWQSFGLCPKVGQLAREAEEGFTLPEVLVVMLVTGFLVTLILYFTFSFWRYGYLQEADLDTLITRLNSGDYLREAIGASSGMISQNSIADSHTLNPDTTIPSGLYWIPIHAIPGTTSIGTSGTKPVWYYRHFSQNSSGAFIMNGSQPYEDEYVLYMNGSTKQLLVRTLANPNATGNKAKTSCPPALATANCPSDKIIASNVSSVALRYFSRTGNLIDYTSITDPNTGSYIGPDFPSVEVVELTLNISKKPIFQTTNATTNSTIIRVALRNS